MWAQLRIGRYGSAKDYEKMKRVMATRTMASGYVVTNVGQEFTLSSVQKFQN